MLVCVRRIQWARLATLLLAYYRAALPILPMLPRPAGAPSPPLGAALWQLASRPARMPALLVAHVAAALAWDWVVPPVPGPPSPWWRGATTPKRGVGARLSGGTGVVLGALRTLLLQFALATGVLRWWAHGAEHASPAMWAAYLGALAALHTHWWAQRTLGHLCLDGPALLVKTPPTPPPLPTGDAAQEDGAASARAPATDHPLVVTGPYAWVRHPSLSGLWFAHAALWLLLGSCGAAGGGAAASWHGGLALLLFGWQALGVARAEEDVLGQHFGEKWHRYCWTRERFLPCVL